ncbi:hypothetical protein AQPE_1198 [Aquipluma nitroreducens]|uniref:Uncharacterized protein n=1 Tax=Aquipluma nitroreducens TaxID=2010828 RepID=A0A5K7S6C9_9BACT|nr:hypothetical protein AQPE_1198 [Aquipluma nitroreducens]
MHIEIFRLVLLYSENKQFKANRTGLFFYRSGIKEKLINNVDRIYTELNNK